MSTTYRTASLHNRPAVFEVPPGIGDGAAAVRSRGRLIAMKTDGVWSLHGLVEVRDRRYIEILDSTLWAEEGAP